MYLNSANKDEVDGGPPSLEPDHVEGNKLNGVSTSNQDVPGIVISTEDTEISERDVAVEKTVVTVHKEISQVVDDNGSISLEHDVSEKEVVENVVTESQNPEKDESDVQVIMVFLFVNSENVFCKLLQF